MSAFIQGNETYSSASGNSWTCAFSSSVTSGNLIVVAVAGIPYATNLAFSVSDTVGTTYSTAVAHSASVGGSTVIMTIFYGVAPSGGSNTVAVTYPTTSGGSTNYNRILVHEYGSGLDSLDQAVYDTGTGTSLSTGSMTTTHATETVFGWMLSNAGISAAGSGFTQREVSGSEITEDMDVTSTGSYAATASSSSSDDWMALGATFYASGGGGGGGGGTTDPIVTDIGPSTNSTTVNVSGMMVIDTPENHGAKRDGRMVLGTYTASSHVFTLDSSVPSSRQFVSGDVGKTFVLRNPSPGATTVVTVSSVTDATHCVLSGGPGSNYATTFAVLGTDDTASVNAAINYAVSQAQEQGLNAAKVSLSEGVYMLAAATTKTTDTLGNAQIPLPIVPPALQSKFVLEISGPIDTTAPIHWDQTTPSLSGAVLFSTLLGQSTDGTYGNPSVIGGPTPQGLGNIGYPDGWSSGNNIWSNVHMILKNFQLTTPVNTSMLGIDLRDIATASIDGVSCLPFDTPANFSAFGSANIDSGQVAVYMPSVNNNDLDEIGALTIYGWNYGLAVTDHTNIKSIRCIFCNSGILIAGPGDADYLAHGWHVEYASIEGCQIGVDATIIKSHTDYAANFPTTIAHLDSEGGYDIKDPNDFLTGYAWIGNIYSNAGSGKPDIVGAGSLNIYSFYQQRGAVTAPTIPSSATALANPFWRDVAVTVTGGQVTDIAVAGQSLGIATGTVIVPTGKSITLTYSGSGSAPAWNWTVL